FARRPAGRAEVTPSWQSFDGSAKVLIRHPGTRRAVRTSTGRHSATAWTIRVRGTSVERVDSGARRSVRATATGGRSVAGADPRPTAGHGGAGATPCGRATGIGVRVVAGTGTGGSVDAGLGVRPASTGRIRAGRLLPGGLRRAGPGDATSGSGRTRVRWWPDGPLTGSAFRSRVRHGERTCGTAGQIACGRRRTALGGPAAGRGRRTPATPVDHRQAGIGVWQPAGLTQPVRRPFRAVRPGLTANRRASALLVGGRPPAAGTLGGCGPSASGASRRGTGRRRTGRPGTRLRRTGLHWAGLRWNGLPGAGLRRTRLPRARLRRTSLPRTGLRRTALARAGLRRSGLLHSAGAGLGRTGLAHTWLPGARLRSAAGLRAAARHTTLLPNAGLRAARLNGGRGRHRRRVARARHRCFLLVGGTAAAGGRAGRTGGLRCPRVRRAGTTPGRARVTVDRGVGSWAVGGLWHHTGRRTVVGRWTAGRGGFGAGPTVRWYGVRSARWRHRLRPAGQYRGVRSATGRGTSARWTDRWAGRRRRRTRPGRAGGSPCRRERPGWASRVAGGRAGCGRRRSGGPGTGAGHRLCATRRRLALRRGAGTYDAGTLGRGTWTCGAGTVGGWPLVRATSLRRLTRPGAVSRAPRAGAVRVTTAWSGRRVRRRRHTRAWRHRFGRCAVRAQLGALLLGRAQVVDPAELLAGHRLLRLGLGSAPTPSAALGAGITPLVRALVRAIRTTRSHC
ncbi:hypothetical protein ABZS52_28115, partial [Micromonospora profundi]